MKKFLSFTIALVFVLSLVGSINPSFISAENKLVEVTFPTFLSGENVGAIFFGPQIERFNTKYEGQYKINIEEVPQAAYAEKIKQLALQQQLPVMVHSPGSGGIDLQWFHQVVIANDLAHDLTAFAEANPEVSGSWLDASVDYSTFDGKLLVKPSAVIRPIGLYYNQTMFDPETDISQMTPEEFMQALVDTDQKVALMTGENAWTSSLFLSAFIANQEDGANFLSENADDKLYDYSDERIVKGIEQLQKFYNESAASNSLGAAYAEAANAFMSKEAAVIANGSWMAGDFSEESQDKWSNDFTGDDVKATLYPGNVAIANERMFGEFWISANASDEEKALAEAFFAFRDSQEEIEAFILAEGGVAPKIEYSEDFLEAQKENRILNELSSAINDETVYSDNILSVMPASVADSEFGKLLPKLFDGTLTPEEFTAELTRKAEEAR